MLTDLIFDFRVRVAKFEYVVHVYTDAHTCIRSHYKVNISNDKADINGGNVYLNYKLK